ncbi:MAG: DUF1800 family protein [Saprospiraceae bacterium]|nr:DUF1800 family protein [Saprospiraceae bacterium]
MASLSPLAGTLGHRRAAHLLRRTSFNFTKPRVDQMAGQTAAQALDSLLQLQAFNVSQPFYKDLQVQGSQIETWLLPLPGSPFNDLPAEDFVLRRWVISWWCNEALRDTGIGHKMQFFFHQFMQTTANTARSSAFFDYLQLMRWGALGNFKKLCYKLVVDNNMLVYLNNTQNTKNNPNENFAREFFELFTIGKGPQIGPGDYTNYTEDDIVAAARVLTGFRTRLNRDVVDAETGIPRGDVAFNAHDVNSKQFSAKFNGTVITGASNAAEMWVELQAFVDMVFAQPETAKNLCRRLYRFFVGRNITSEIENDIIVPLSNTLVANNFEVKPVLQQLLQSQHFFDADDADNADETVGGMIKSPLELNFQTMSFFGMPLPDPMVNTAAYFQIFERGMMQRAFSTANLPLFFASDVAGYPAYYQEPDYSHQWFNSSTIISRYKMPEMFLSGLLTIGGTPTQQLGTKLNIAPWVRNSGVISNALDSQVLVEDLLKYLLPEEVDTDRFNYFHITVFLDNLPPADWTYEWQNYLNTNDATEVTLALERLIKAVLFSPEYQTF